MGKDAEFYILLLQKLAMRLVCEMLLVYAFLSNVAILTLKIALLNIFTYFIFHEIALHKQSGWLHNDKCKILGGCTL